MARFIVAAAWMAALITRAERVDVRDVAAEEGDALRVLVVTQSRGKLSTGGVRRALGAFGVRWRDQLETPIDVVVVATQKWQASKGAGVFARGVASTVLGLDARHSVRTRRCHSVVAVGLSSQSNICVFWSPQRVGAAMECSGVSSVRHGGGGVSAIVRCRLRSALQGGRESRVAFVGALLPGAAGDEASVDEEDEEEGSEAIRSLTMASALRDVVDAVNPPSADGAEAFSIVLAGALGSRYETGGAEQLQALLRPSLPGPSLLGGVLSEGGVLPGPSGSFAGPFNPLTFQSRDAHRGLDASITACRHGAPPSFALPTAAAADPAVLAAAAASFSPTRGQYTAPSLPPGSGPDSPLRLAIAVLNRRLASCGVWKGGGAGGRSSDLAALRPRPWAHGHRVLFSPPRSAHALSDILGGGPAVVEPAVSDAAGPLYESWALAPETASNAVVRLLRLRLSGGSGSRFLAA